MGVCLYCGKSAGWFSDRHDECVKVAQKPYADLKDAAYQWVYGTYDFQKFGSVLVPIHKTPGIDLGKGRQSIVRGFDEGLAKFLDDKLIGSVTLERVALMMGEFNITWDEVSKETYLAWRKQKTIFHVKHKQFEKTGKKKDDLSIRFLKNEKLLWAFHGVDLREEAVKRRHVGKSAGVRVRIGKRTSVNLGRSEGHWEETIVHPVVDTGVLCVTDQRVYFAGSSHSQHFDIEDIESLSYGNRSMTILRDTDEYEPLRVSDLDGEFAHELVSKLIAD